VADKTTKKQPRGRGKGIPFKPGQAGNPKGRPQELFLLVQELKRNWKKFHQTKKLLIWKF